MIINFKHEKPKLSVSGWVILMRATFKCDGVAILDKEDAFKAGITEENQLVYFDNDKALCATNSNYKKEQQGHLLSIKQWFRKPYNRASGVILEYKQDGSYVFIIAIKEVINNHTLQCWISHYKPDGDGGSIHLYTGEKTIVMADFKRLYTFEEFGAQIKDAQDSDINNIITKVKKIKRFGINDVIYNYDSIKQ